MICVRGSYAADAQQVADELDGLREDLAGSLDDELVFLVDFFEVLFEVEFSRRLVFGGFEERVELRFFFLDDGAAGLHELGQLLGFYFVFEGLEGGEHVVVSEVLCDVLVDLVDHLVPHDLVLLGVGVLLVRACAFKHLYIQRSACFKRRRVSARFESWRRSEQWDEVRRLGSS